MTGYGIQQRGRTWYVRKRVPLDLIETVGKREWIESLKTTDRNLAEARKHAVLARIEEEFSAARDVSEDSPSSPAWLVAQAQDLCRQQRSGLDADIAMDYWGILLDEHFQAARVRWDEGRGPVLTPGHEQAILDARDIAAMSEISLLHQTLEDYLAEIQQAVVPKTHNAKSRALTRFRDWLVRDVRMDRIDRRLCGRYLHECLLKQEWATKTLQDEISHLRAFFSWTDARGIIEGNPCSNLIRSLPVSRRGTSKGVRRAWKPEELKILLESVPPTDHIWQMAALGLYTGMRVTEIAETRLEDVSDDSIFVREGKTDSAVRHVPLHPIIHPLVAYLASKPNDGYMIDGLKRGGENNARSHVFAKRFSYHNRKRLGISDPGVVFHTLRNSFMQACEEAGVPESTTKLIVGHSRQSLTYGLYSGGVSQSQLARAISQVSFGPIDDLVTTTLRSQLPSGLNCKIKTPPG